MISNVEAGREMTGTMADSDIYDVAIVGYGPTGLALAYWLGRAGHRVVVAERWPNLYTLPRAGHVDGEVMRLFQRMGVAETIAADSEVHKRGVVLGSTGEKLAEVPTEPCNQGWKAHYSLYQPTLESVLDGRVRQTGCVTVMQGWRVETFDHDGDLVDLRLVASTGASGAWEPTGGEKTITARWLIGADGANSTVKQHLGVADHDLGYSSRALVVFVDRLDATVGADMPDNELGMTLPRPYVAWRKSGKRYARWEWHVHPHETDAEMNQASKTWELIKPWGFTPDNARLVRHSVFEFRTLVADDWRVGNVLLAGDAAHQMPPFQGQGMCSGQRDAAGLAWRLDLILRGISDPDLLDSYMPERKPHVIELTHTSAQRAKQFWITDVEAARARDAEMMRIFARPELPPGHGVVPTLVSGVLHSDGGAPIGPAGRLSPQFEVRHNGETRLLDDYIGADWLLLSVGRTQGDALDSREQALLDRIGVRIVALGPEGSGFPFEDVRGNYHGWFTELGISTVLIRPDSYIFGGADSPAALRRLLSDFADQLRLRA